MRTGFCAAGDLHENGERQIVEMRWGFKLLDRHAVQSEFGYRTQVSSGEQLNLERAVE